MPRLAHPHRGICAIRWRTSGISTSPPRSTPPCDTGCAGTQVAGEPHRGARPFGDARLRAIILAASLNYRSQSVSLREHIALKRRTRRATDRDRSNLNRSAVQKTLTSNEFCAELFGGDDACFASCIVIVEGDLDWNVEYEYHGRLARQRIAGCDLRAGRRQQTCRAVPSVPFGLARQTQHPRSQTGASALFRPLGLRKRGLAVLAG
jgi:hypothetical protein